ncbi:DUF4399 domain-containing protein [Fulvivirgaceae bacterium BMA10]|uniref:DUF4399 domain-containing protein n=1 Tax=Splendidivirga corallicola TaxID=3051826 RepID=A0ABT8KTN3_9BACT|nr:DUF4399 domain-containing protein [Fulvivirgaceae bacterium BMA10]
MKKIFLFIIVCGVAFACSSNKKSDESSGNEAQNEATSSETEETKPEVFFLSPQDGDTVGTTVRVSMGVKGMEVEPAGAVNEGKGHHHIIIDGSFIEKGVVVPADSTHIHYGKGQTEVEVTLQPGTHTLTMQFADGFHQSYGESMSAQITVVVSED